MGATGCSPTTPTDSTWPTVAGAATSASLVRATRSGAARWCVEQRLGRVRATSRQTCPKRRSAGRGLPSLRDLRCVDQGGWEEVSTDYTLECASAERPAHDPQGSAQAISR